MRRMAARLEQETPARDAGELWVATYTLLGLRYTRDEAAQLLRGVRNMRESVTYQAILGHPFLSHFKLTVDYADKILVLERNAKAKN